MKSIQVSLNPRSIDNAVDKIRRYTAVMKRKAKKIVERLAAYGATSASIGFSRAVYTGNKDADITVEETEKGYVVKASGESVLFIEFGSGLKFMLSGPEHPEAEKFGMGYGTYPIPPGKGNWDNIDDDGKPSGWYLPSEKGGEHTFGNPANMPMYLAKEDMRQHVAEIAREVFAND